MIQVHELRKTYGETLALDGLSFAMERGEILGLLGPNGAGKTSTLRILTGTMAADGGRVELDGQDVFRRGSELKRCSGYLPEHNPLYPEMSPRASLRYFGRLYGLGGDNLRRACDRALGDFGLASVAGRPARELSKGYRQRLGLALALLHDPDLVFLDEPTSGLDPLTVRELRQLIRSFGAAGGGAKTVLISTHVLSEVEAICDRVLILNEGRAVAEGSLQQLSRELTGGVRFELKVSFPGEALPDWSASGQVLTARRLGEGEPQRWSLTLAPDAEAPAALTAWIHARGGRLYELRGQQAGLEEIYLDVMRGQDVMDGEGSA